MPHEIEKELSVTPRIRRPLAWAAALVLLAACQPGQTGAGSDAPETSAAPSGEPAAAATGTAAPAGALETEEQKTAYALGFGLGRNVQPLDLNQSELDALKQGIQDAASNAMARVDVDAYQQQVQALAQRRSAVLAAAAKEAGKVFEEAKAQEAGAQRFDSGLIMIVQQEGEGASPAASDKVTVHYQGKLIDGSVFDSSVQRGQPATFPLNGVIPCWTEALQKMKVGGKAQLVCPSDIAYGDRGLPPRISPGATLVFEVELIEIAG